MFTRPFFPNPMTKEKMWPGYMRLVNGYVSWGLAHTRIVVYLMVELHEQFKLKYQNKYGVYVCVCPENGHNLCVINPSNCLCKLCFVVVCTNNQRWGSYLLKVTRCLLLLPTTKNFHYCYILPVIKLIILHIMITSDQSKVLDHY